MLGSFITFIHVLVCIVLILSVLMQSGKGGGLSSAFGGGGGGGGGDGGMSSQMFGGRGAGTFLGKVTSVVAAMYMILVIGLNLIPVENQASQSIIRDEALRQQQSSPAQGLPTVPGQSVTPTAPTIEQPAQSEPSEEEQTPPE